MKAFKLKYQEGEKDRIEIVYGKNSLEIIRCYDLCSKKNVNTRIFELSGEQEAIALSNLEA